MKNLIGTVLHSKLRFWGCSAFLLIDCGAHASLLLKLDSLDAERVAQSAPANASESAVPAANPPASSAPAAVPVAPPAGRPVAAPEWTMQLRATLGGSRIAGESRFKSDRMGAGVFAGKRFGDLSISLPFFEADSVTVGASYQTATGVDPFADRSWSLQNIGAQARVNLSLVPDSHFDFAVQTGVALQRLVSEEPVRRSQKAVYGAGITLGGYARTLMIDGVHAVGGVDLVLGRASSMGLAVGVESNL
jgi:hypothetical protein